MTTTVRVLIEGNKACEAKVTGPQQTDAQHKTLKPGEFAVLTIHGESRVEVKETGDFLS